MRLALLLSAAIALSLLSSRASFAADATIGSGVAGRGQVARVTGGGGRPSEDNLATPGFAAHVSKSIGASGGTRAGGVGHGIDNGFHSAGIGKMVKASRGQDTMNTVPGRAPTYIKIIGGTRVEPLMGARGR
jgi:hypothetical protein